MPSIPVTDRACPPYHLKWNLLLTGGCCCRFLLTTSSWQMLDAVRKWVQSSSPACTPTPHCRRESAVSGGGGGGPLADPPRPSPTTALPNVSRRALEVLQRPSSSHSFDLFASSAESSALFTHQPTPARRSQVCLVLVCLL